MCTGNEIKRTEGNSVNCSADIACDGIAAVPNSRHTDCGKDLVLLKVKDKIIHMIRRLKTLCLFAVTFLIFTVVCNAGYFQSESECVMCTERKIKKTKGNATDCDVDAPCNGVSKVSNTEHTACGKLNYFLKFLLNYSFSTY